MNLTTITYFRSINCERNKRTANLTEQLKGWIKDMGDTIATVASINLRFTTSTEYPLTMGELADFLNENRDFLDCHNIEWCSDYYQFWRQSANYHLACVII